MNFILKPFHEEESDSIRVTASLDVSSSEVQLRFRVEDPEKQIDWGDLNRRTENRGHDLWKKTCFELFLGRHGSEIYHEFNFAPSGEWDALSFTRYREGRDDYVSAGISFNSTTHFHVDPQGTAEAQIDLLPTHGSRFQFLVFTRDFDLQIAMVAQMKNGQQKLFAFQHADSKPDFHKRDLFTNFS